jgi:predicted aspartyl protease
MNGGTQMNINFSLLRSIRVALIGLVVTAACRNLQAESDVHFRLIDGNLIVIALNSGSRATFDFLLDTGTDTTVIDPSIASKLSFVPEDRIEVVSLSGSHSASRGSIPTLAAGASRVDNVQVLLQELPGLRRLDSHIAGILGQSFLSHFNYLVDYRRQVVRFESENEVLDTIDGEHVAIESRDHRMVVASEVQSRASANLRLVLDSGADSLVLLHTASQTLNLPMQSPSLQLVQGGQVEMKTGRVNVLTVGSEKLHQITAILPDVDPSVPMGDGLLPTILFRAVYVNNRDGFVVFNPRTRKN